MQVGCGCCCCCCCCLHWAGAAIGGIAGIQAAYTSDEGKDAQPGPKKIVYSTAMAGLLVTLFCLPFACVAPFSGPTWLVQFVWPLIVCTFAPSLVFVPIGIVTLISGAMALHAQEKRGALPADEDRYGVVKFAWRVASKAFVLSSLAAGIGYVVMLLLALAIGGP